MGVSEAVDRGDLVFLKDDSGPRSGHARDEEERTVWACLGLPNELPRRSRIDVLLELHSYAHLAAGVANERVDASICRAKLRDHGQTGNTPQDFECRRLERSLNFHYFTLIHSDCEYSLFCENGKRPLGKSTCIDGRLWTRCGVHSPAASRRHRAGAEVVRSQNAGRTGFVVR